MPLDHFVSLGRSGLRVSPLCLGTMTFGEDWGWGSSVADSEAILERYVARGGNFIDTANIYTKGHSEKILGDWFAKHPGRRDRLVLATKFMATLHPSDPNAGGAGRKAITAALEQSLRRLRTDYVDLYWMHVYDRLTPIEETMQTLDDLVRAGKVRYIGFSDTPAWKVAEAHTMARLRGWTPLIALQIEYSLLQRTVEGQLIPAALDLGLGVTPWGPLASGALSGKYTRAKHGQHEAGRGEWTTGRLNDKVYDLIETLAGIAKRHGSTPARVALAWLRVQPGVTSTILGARTLAQLEDNIGSLDLALTREDLEQLSAGTKPVLDFPYDFVQGAGSFAYGDTHVDGVQNQRRPFAPATLEEVH
jgi:aryl-alcohol dehydrogenase-like predicted oxidoreductase